MASTNKKMISIAATILLLGIFVFYILKFDSIRTIAETFLDLTKADLVFTPVFGILFFAFYKAFDKVFFRDYLDFLARREALTSDVATNLSQTIAEAEEIEKAVAEQISAKQFSLQKHRDLVALDKKKELETKVKQASENSEIQLKNKRSELANEVSAMEGQIENQSDDLSENLIQKVLQPAEKIGMIQ